MRKHPVRGSGKTAGQARQATGKVSGGVSPCSNMDDQPYEHVSQRNYPRKKVHAGDWMPVPLSTVILAAYFGGWTRPQFIQKWKKEKKKEEQIKETKKLYRR